MESLQLCVLVLLLAPSLFALLILLPHRTFRYGITLFSVLTLAAVAAISFGLVLSHPSGGAQWILPKWVSHVFAGGDFLLLGLFSLIGFRTKNPRIIALSLAQVPLLLWLTLSGQSGGHASVPDISVDRLAALMFLLINGVGGVIAFFSLRYMDDETTTEHRRSRFVATLVAFLGVMNFLVAANNIEWFFFAFEATTLTSFFLIGFRRDDVSNRNAQTALWMNQIGGLALLVGCALLATNQGIDHFSSLFEVFRSGRGEGLWPLLPLAFMTIAALVKGAQIPFSGWLRGAMVAPTPVSAMLHSSTMVKIAPYLLLRLAPFMKGTWLGFTIILLTGAGFVFAAVMALNETNFKRVLAWSTVALLALMMMSAVIGTPQAMTAAIALMLFHGVSKALLFLQAGILEKVFHKKKIEDFGQLIRYAPLTTYFINCGFLSIALPPFGAFIGKWLALATATSGMDLVRLILPILFMSFGSVILSILYFRVMGVLVMKRDDHYRQQGGRAIQLERLPFVYLISGLGLWAVLAWAALFIAPILADGIAPAASQLLALGDRVSWIHSENLSIALGYTTIYFWQIIIAFLLVVAVPVVGYLVLLKNVDLVKEYACGEKIVSDYSMHSYSGAREAERMSRIAMLVLLFLVIVAGVVGR